jgi:hypothetical protein
MPTSHTARNLSEPSGRAKIPGPTLAYFRTRTRMRMFTLVRRELRKSGLTKAVLAQRLGKGADQINHWLATPQNWTLDTLSDFLFAISGAELDNTVSHPFEAQKGLRNEDSTTAAEKAMATELVTPQSNATAIQILGAMSDSNANTTHADISAAIDANTITSAPTRKYEEVLNPGAQQISMMEVQGVLSALASAARETEGSNLSIPPAWLAARLSDNPASFNL